MLRKYNKGISLIETLISILMISVFFVLIMNLTLSQNQFQHKYIDKFRMYNHFHNVIQIIKSDPSFFDHVEQYYNINGEAVHDITTPDNKFYYVNIYFDEDGLISYQANAYYFIHITLTLYDYTDYYDYYYYIRINRSNVTNTIIGSKGVYLHFTKNK